MKMVIVRKVGPIFKVNTKHGERDKRFYTVEEASTKKQYDASMFISSSTPEVSIGTECLMDIVVDGKYTNIKRIETINSKAEAPKKEEKVEEKKEEKKEPVSNGMTQAGWDEKEKRDFRGRAIMYGLETLQLAGGEDTTKCRTSEIENLVMMSADNYLTYIYDGKKPLPIEDSIVSEQ